MANDKHCLNCAHHAMGDETKLPQLLPGKSVICNHPQRPDAPMPVVKWTAGCQQHEAAK